MSDHSLPLREALIQVLRAAPSIQALVEERVFESVPDDAVDQIPYIRYGSPIIRPNEADTIAGISTDVVFHCFDDSPDTDRVHHMMEAVRLVLADQSLTLVGGGVHYYTTWTGSNLLDDGSGKNSRHGIVSFTIVTG